MISLSEYASEKEKLCRENDHIASQIYEEYGVNRGLRDENGVGVLTGLTNISKITSSKIIDGRKQPCAGELWYRGYRVETLIDELGDDGLGFEKIAYLLLIGSMPDEGELREFKECVGKVRTLPTNFTRDVIMKAPTDDIMNSMTRSILTLASYDKQAKDTSVSNSLRQCIRLISEFPLLAVYGYHAYNHYENNGSMYIHKADQDMSTAEVFMSLLRPDRKYSHLEAKVLDTALILHMEHGGGNNSTFTTRVVTSSGSDTYSTMAAAMSSLKGPKHGGANVRVSKMFEDLKINVHDWTNDDAIATYLSNIIDKKAFDRSGLIYGMGHAVYTISDPRARILKSFTERLAKAKGLEDEYDLYARVERLAPVVIGQKKHIYKGVSANVDFYSGFIYNMLDLPTELYTPLFAIARIAGWSAHRMEELINGNKIIRPAYMGIANHKEYKKLADR